MAVLSFCLKNMASYHIERLVHTCPYKGQTSETCLACQRLAELEREKQLGKILDYLDTGGRSSDVIVLEKPTSDELELCFVFLASNGELLEIEIPELDVSGLVEWNYGQLVFYPFGEILEQGWASVHGPSKLVKNQKWALVTSLCTRKFKQKTGLDYVEISSGSYDSCRLVLYNETSAWIYNPLDKQLAKREVLDKQIEARGMSRSGFYFYYGKARDFGLDSDKAVLSSREITPSRWTLVEYPRFFEITRLD